MELWIQPCTACAELHGQPSTAEPHEDLSLAGAGAVKDAQAEQHYKCMRCGGVFVRILAGEPQKRFWMLLNASQH
jgi:hypothetical protein